MDIDAISGAATVALTSTILFLIIAKSWSILSRTVSSTPSFADSIMHEAAQRFRDELDRLSSSQAIYLSGTLVFLVLFGAAYILQAQDLFAGYPSWQLWLQISFPDTGRRIRCVAAWAHDSGAPPREVRPRRKYCDRPPAAADLAGANRVFHDVETSAGVVDHVLVGQTGIYAVNVVARRGGKNGNAFSTTNELRFSSRRTNLCRRITASRPASRKKSASCWATRSGYARSSLYRAGR